MAPLGTARAAVVASGAMWKALRFVCGAALFVSAFGLLFAWREHPRDFRPHEWRPYVDRVADNPILASLLDERSADLDRFRPFGAWSPEFSLLLLALHLTVTASLAGRTALRLRALRALQTGAAARDDAPYRRVAEGAPADPDFADRVRALRVALWTFGTAAVLPCFTSMGKVIVLRAAGEVVRAVPTEIGWYQDVRRDGRGSLEQHAVRARAVVGGRSVALEARCGFGLTQRLDAGEVGPRGVPFVVWPAFPRVHQIGEAPVVGHFAGWAHLAFVAALAFYSADARVKRRDALAQGF